MVRKLEGLDEADALKFMERVSEVASKSSCLRSKCGAVIFKKGFLLGKGYNSPPKDKVPTYCRKSKELKDVEGFKSDKTCCVHAEQRAIIDGLIGKRNYLTLRMHFAETVLFFVRIDEGGNMLPSGKPYCTICSKLALDVGIPYWVLYHGEEVYGEEGFYIYGAEEYNEVSFQFRG